MSTVESTIDETKVIAEKRLHQIDHAPHNIPKIKKARRPISRISPKCCAENRRAARHESTSGTQAINADFIISPHSQIDLLHHLDRNLLAL
ncbi:hypothetical protein [Neogemmobacter tilapiae]|uniref:hypothetical protein n=1 Tax=Neogemmobacter tilapiae TaxID=875041 RepID=UPI00167B29C5|nr:hypothetical protein [Gemmobacter tilapiae]